MMRLAVLILLAWCGGMPGLVAAGPSSTTAMVAQAESAVGAEDPFNFDDGDEEDLDEFSRLAVYILVVVVVGLVGWMLVS